MAATEPTGMTKQELEQELLKEYERAMKEIQTHREALQYWPQNRSPWSSGVMGWSP